MGTSTPNFFPRHGSILDFWAAHPCHSEDLVSPPGIHTCTKRIKKNKTKERKKIETSQLSNPNSRVSTVQALAKI